MNGRIDRRGPATRRLALITALVSVAAVAMATGEAGAASATLGEAAARTGRTFGATILSGTLGEPAYRQIVDREYTTLTPENELKWDATEPGRGMFNFVAADKIAAVSGDRRMRGSFLVWQSQLPAWVSALTGDPLRTAMLNHIAGVVGHMRGKVFAWDVVAEAIDDAGHLRQTQFSHYLGNGYIEDAFRAARAADPDAKLCYSDYQIEDINSVKAQAVYDLVRDLVSRGVPIDCMAFQGHFRSAFPVPPVENFARNMQRFADLGLDVQLSELDVVGSGQPQADAYAAAVNACLAVSRCGNITTSSVRDRDSFSSGTPTLFDRDSNPKQAYTAVLNALNAGGVPYTGGGTTTTTTTTTTATTTTTGDHTTTTTSTGSGACSARASIVGQWPGGFQGGLVVTNRGPATSSWRITFTLPDAGQTVTQGWNGEFRQSGRVVTVSSLPWNGSLATGSSLALGFLASWVGTNPLATDVALNGGSCEAVSQPG